MKHFRYNKATILTKKLYRKLFPVPTSPWTMGAVEDICAIELVPPVVLKSFFKTCFFILKEKKGEDIGDYMEFGIFNGSSLGSAWLSAKEDNVSMRFFGFDAFEGLPANAEHEDDGVWKKGFYACTFEQMKQCLQKRDVDVDAIHWINGWYSETLNKDIVNEYDMNNPGIVFVDCDTYSSSKSVLDFLATIISKPLIICFDDWKLNDLDIKEMGEYKSFNEFLDSNPQLTATEIPSYNRKSKTFLIEV